MVHLDALLLAQAGKAGKGFLGLLKEAATGNPVAVLFVVLMVAVAFCGLAYKLRGKNDLFSPDGLEWVTFALAGLTVAGVAAGVTLISLIPGGLRSGIEDSVINSAVATGQWLNEERNRNGVKTVEGDGTLYVEPMRVAVASTGGQPATPQQQQEAMQQITKEMPTQYFGDDIPPEEQVEHIPWLRKMPGVAYQRPKAIPEILYRKYQSFQDTWNVVQEGGGEFVETDAGTAYQVNWVNEASLLYSKIGLRPGDKVIAVNGQPVGRSMDAGKAMFEQMKNERRFAVLIERQGRKTVLSYTVR